jgi:hypothetical protein
LGRKVAKIISNLASEIAICDAAGVRRVTALLVITLLATQALIEARRTSDDTWAETVSKWVQDLKSKAKMDILLSAQVRAAYTLSALAQRSAACPPRGHQTSAGSAGSPPPHMQAGALRGGRPREFADEPDKFVWCGVCNKPTHCLWDCRFVLDKIRHRLKQGTSAQQSADFWIKKTKERYSAKGAAFLNALEARPEKTREALLGRLSA